MHEQIDQEGFLQHEEFIKKVLKLREPKSLGFLDFLKSPSVVALVTVIAGALVSVLVTSGIQREATERQFQNGIINLYGEHSLLAQRDMLKDRSEVRNAALDLVGKALARGEARIATDGPRYARRINPEHQKLNIQQKQKIVRSFNTVLEEWDTKKGSIGPSLGLLFGQETEDSWGVLVDSLDSYLECATYHQSEAEQLGGQHSCGGDRLSTESALAHLQDSFRLESTRPWLSEGEVIHIRNVLSASAAER